MHLAVQGVYNFVFFGFDILDTLYDNLFSDYNYCTGCLKEKLDLNF